MSQNVNDAILIVGGYGVVGQQTTELIRKRHPDVPLLIAGRNHLKSLAFISKLTNTDFVVLDIEQPDPLGELKPRAILALANDPFDHLLLQAVRRGIPYIDITRWTKRLTTAVSRVSGESFQAPVMLSSAWMAGVTVVVAVAACHKITTVNRIDISILYSLKDKAGPNSAEYMDRLSTPFEVMLNKKRQQVYPCTDPRKTTFPGGYSAKVYRFDTPDQHTLPFTTGATTVAARIAFDNAIATNLLILLSRSGIWGLISNDRFTPLRRSLLYNPGKGASHEIAIEVVGTDENNNPQTIHATIVDPKGQTHLTALGALIQLERLLGLDGAPPPDPGIVYPDTAPQIDSALNVLRDFGVTVDI